MISVTVAITERKADSQNAIKHSLLTAEDSWLGKHSMDASHFKHFKHLIGSSACVDFQSFKLHSLCHIADELSQVVDPSKNLLKVTVINVL